MNTEHAFDLLMAISTRDQRTIGETDAAAWANDLVDVTLDEALEAVTAFHQSEVAQRRRIVAADIVQWVRARRRQLVEQQHAADVVGEARGGAWREITGETSRQPWRELWQRLKAEEHERCQVRRASVLRYPDLAEALSSMPGGFAQPQQWNGYLPPERDGYGRLNRSAHRLSLVEIVEEAERRDTNSP